MKEALKERQEFMRKRSRLDSPFCACGCGARVTKDAKNFIKGHQSRLLPFESLYNQFKDTAYRHTHIIYFSFKEFLEFTKILKCHYCDAQIIWRPFKSDVPGQHSTYNLDRKNNSIGYTWDNCVVCCPRCNRAKGHLFSYEEWVVMTAALKKAKTAAA